MKKNKNQLIYIEDNSDEVDFLHTELEKSGIEVDFVHFSDGESGLNYIKTIIDKDHLNKCVIILDLNLPKMSGKEILASLQNYKKNHQLPILIFTGSENPQDEESCMLLGAQGFFVKPWDVSTYIEFIQGLFMKFLT